MANSGIVAFFKAMAKRPMFSRTGGGAGGGTANDGNIIRFWDSWATFDREDDVTDVGEFSRASIVMAAVNWLGRTLPEAPLTVVEETPEGDEVIDNHPAIDLWNTPNPFYANGTLIKGIAYSWIVSGNPFLVKARAGRRVAELWYIPPAQMKPWWAVTGDDYVSGYEHMINGTRQFLPKEDVIHLRDGIDPLNTRMGISPLASVLREISSDQQIASYSASLMKNGAVPPVVISPKETALVGFNAQEVRASYIRQTQGTERGKALVVPQSLNIEHVGFSPAELDLKALRRLPEERIAAVIGIPAIVLGFGAGMDRTTYNNVQGLVEFATETYLVPLYRYIEQELTMQLLREFDDNPKHRMAFDLKKVRALEDDVNKLYTRVTVAYNGGVLKRSEARQLLGFDAMPEDEMYKPAPAAPDMTQPDQQDNQGNQDQQDNQDEPMTDEGKEFKEDSADATASDATLRAGHQWLLKIGEDRVAAMLGAKKK